MTNTNLQAITLWGVSISPYVRKVMIALAEKNVDYELKQTLPKSLLEALQQEIPAEFEQASALGKIPALQQGDICLSDSSVIAQYLDMQYDSGNPLYPAAAFAHAKAKWFEHYSDNILTPTTYQQIFVECVVKPKVLKLDTDNTIVETAIKTSLPKHLVYLEMQLNHHPWFAGEQFSMADVAIVTQFLAVEMSGFDNFLQPYPQLQRHFNQTLARRSLQELLSP